MSEQLTILNTSPIVKELKPNLSYKERLQVLLSEDLDFHGKKSGYASHNFHSFPAKFPPQLPRKFINGLTNYGDVVLDPMVGSGTTVLEALLAGRRGIGTDIDPLALKISSVKVTPINLEQVAKIGNEIIENASFAIKDRNSKLADELTKRWDKKTQQFVDYWFASETQIELLALAIQIEKIADKKLGAFFELIFSAIIITKSGGVSLAFDLAHTRPHRAKVVIAKSGEPIIGANLIDSPDRRVKFLTKTLRSPLEEFRKRFQQNSNDTILSIPKAIQPYIVHGNAQKLPLSAASADLIVTSPPYASHAIDYMRAHKFSLVWFGYAIDELSKKRQDYIGGEAVSSITFEEMPDKTASVVSAIANQDKKKGRVLHRYYSEMTRTMKEMYRVLKPSKAAVVVVGSSIMRGVDIEIQKCLAEIGKSIGFEVPKIGVRTLDRNRRMLPTSSKLNLNSQIQQRMHKEYIIGFYKPEV